MTTPPVPGMMTDQPSGGPTPGAEQLLGPQASPAPQQDMQQVLRAEVARIHQAISQIETMARAHPEAASHFQRAIQALAQATQAVTQGLTRGQEGPPPPTVG